MLDTAKPREVVDEAKFRAALAENSLSPLWDVLHALVPKHPAPRAAPVLWSYPKIAPLLFQAGDLISAEQAERRVLILENPALPGQARATSTLYAGIQLVLPGEVAPGHRHTQSALRFILEGDSAFTAVEGERLHMHPYDLVLTPNWCWHDHGNETTAPMVWLDGLDIPLLAALDAGFAEPFLENNARIQPLSRRAGDNLARFGANMRPATPGGLTGAGPERLMIYPYAQWRPALDALLASGGADAKDGVRMEFTNPVDGGSVMRTISAFVQLVPEGLETRGVRSTDGAIYVVVEGEGYAMIGETEYRLAEGDIFVVPSWAERRFSARRDLVLFSYSDKATQERLGLWREQLL
jgi:gentisate 1,2-dioxygenase